MVLKQAEKIVWTVFFTVCMTVMTVSCSRDQTASSVAAQATVPGNNIRLIRTVVLSGLSNPWDLAFTSDGAMFFTEKCLGLSVRHANGTIRRLFGTAGSAVVASDYFCQGQSGMNGVAVDPGFAENRFV